MKKDKFFINEEPFFDHEMITLCISPVASFIDDELEKGVIKASLNMGYEIDEAKLKKWIERCIKLDKLDENTVNDIAIEKKFRQLKNEIDYLKNRPDTKWQKLKEWIEKDHNWNLERGNNDCALGQRWVLDKMQELEAEDVED